MPKKPVNTTKKLDINKDTNIADLVFAYPQAAEVLLDYGLHCVGCAGNSFDSIEMGAKIHGMTDDEINEIVDRVKEVILYKE